MIQDSPDLDLEDLSHLDLEESEAVLTEEDWPDLDSDLEEDLDLEEMDTHGPRLVTTPNMPPLIHLMTSTSTL